MVPLENKNSYLSKISDSPKLSAFNYFLMNKAIVQPKGHELNEADEIYYGIISAIQSDDKVAFEKYYNRKSKSNPNKDSPAPFVNDDFLIFSIIMGVSKFNIDKAWIKNIVSIRSKNTITTTLDNLLTKNYYSTSNLPEVVLMFLQHIDQSLITNDFLNSTFKRINENNSLFENKNDFQVLCAIYAYDFIILLKQAPEGSEIQQLKSFNSSFIKRSKVLSWILQAGLMFMLFYGLLKLPVYSPESVEIINKYGYVFTILGALGITFLGNQLNLISQKSHEFTMKLLGYPNELIKKSEK